MNILKSTLSRKVTAESCQIYLEHGVEKLSLEAKQREFSKFFATSFSHSHRTGTMNGVKERGPDDSVLRFG